MERHKQFAPVVAVATTFSMYTEPDHLHNHYEIIYIKKGAGTHFLNGEKITFRAGSLFLIDPSDIHHFETTKDADFVVIKFTESFINENRNIPRKWSREFSYMASSRTLRHAMFEFDETNTPLIEHIFDTVVAAQNDENIIYLQILSIMEVIKKMKTAQKEIPLHPKVVPDRRVESLLSYIHQNITNPKALKTGDIGQRFGISNHYVSTYFKRNMGLTLHQYIDHYRMALIQNRLLQSDFTVKEIAFDFGFTDESHLNKTFKKYWGMSAKAYREANL